MKLEEQVIKQEEGSTGGGGRIYVRKGCEKKEAEKRDKEEMNDGGWRLAGWCRRCRTEGRGVEGSRGEGRRSTLPVEAPALFWSSGMVSNVSAQCRADSHKATLLTRGGA